MVTIIVGAVVLVILIILLVIMNVKAVQNQKKTTTKNNPENRTEQQQTTPEIKRPFEHETIYKEPKPADHAYRDALRNFSAQVPTAPASKEEKITNISSSDNEYRNALRNLHQNKHE